jgi:hypothetical protein
MFKLFQRLLGKKIREKAKNKMVKEKVLHIKVWQEKN